jgi:hypothetical protein
MSFLCSSLCFCDRLLWHKAHDAIVVVGGFTATIAV